jgi:hypothetical protein
MPAKGWEEAYGLYFDHHLEVIERLHQKRERMELVRTRIEEWDLQKYAGMDTEERIRNSFRMEIAIDGSQHWIDEYKKVRFANRKI